MVSVQAFGKSVRVSAVIDEIFEQTGDHMLVMSRRDALRAASEEVLSRSTLDDFKNRALHRSKGMLNKFAQARLEKERKAAHTHGEYIDSNSHQFMHY